MCNELFVTFDEGKPRVINSAGHSVKVEKLTIKFDTIDISTANGSEHQITGCNITAIVDGNSIKVTWISANEFDRLSQP